MKQYNPGVLTLEILEQAYQRSANQFGKPDIIPLAQSTIDLFVAFQKRENWIKSLPERQQRQIRLKDRLKYRKPYKRMNLPE